MSNAEIPGSNPGWCLIFQLFTLSSAKCQICAHKTRALTTLPTSQGRTQCVTESTYANGGGETQGIMSGGILFGPTKATMLRVRGYSYLVLPFTRQRTQSLLLQCRFFWKPIHGDGLGHDHSVLCDAAFLAAICLATVLQFLSAPARYAARYASSIVLRRGNLSYT
jgi:hypothetical protein